MRSNNLVKNIHHMLHSMLGHVRRLMHHSMWVLLIGLFGLAGCMSHYIVPADGSFVAGDGQVEYTEVPLTWDYTEPQDSGLFGIRPYPNPNSVCRTVLKTTLTEPYFKDGVLLVACPKHEAGAIGDLLSAGAKEVGYAKHWTLLHELDREH